jgi:rRNA maturation endonuclease Nob1
MSMKAKDLFVIIYTCIWAVLIVIATDTGYIPCSIAVVQSTRRYSFSNKSIEKLTNARCFGRKESNMKQYMRVCEKCGNTFVSDNDTRFCKSCFEELLKKYDKL